MESSPATQRLASTDHCSKSNIVIRRRKTSAIRSKRSVPGPSRSILTVVLFTLPFFRVNILKTLSLSLPSFSVLIPASFVSQLSHHYPFSHSLTHSLSQASFFLFSFLPSFLSFLFSFLRTERTEAFKELTEGDFRSDRTVSC